MDDDEFFPALNVTQRVHSIVTGDQDPPSGLRFRIRVVFIDDEVRVLDALRRMLRPRRHEWEMLFFSDPKEAIEWIKEHRVHVVVSDMRMPEIDGVQLLERVQQLQPQALRFILSGNAKRSEVVRSVGPVHQYLAKPCNPEDLQQIIVHTMHLRSLAAGVERYPGLMAMDHLPSSPAILSQFRERSSDPNATLDDLARIIEADPGLATRLLKLVNSPYFGLRRSLGRVSEALAVIGLEGAEGLAMAQHTFSQMQPPAGPLKVLYDGLWDHSQRTASLARRICGDLGGDRTRCESAFFGGLMHDIGILMLMSANPNHYQRLVEASNKYLVALHLAEERVFNCNHAQAAAYLLGGWGVTDDVLESVIQHHAPPGSHSSISSMAVCLADSLDRAAHPLPSLMGAPIDRSLFQVPSVKPHLQSWIDLARMENQA